ncbi:TIGR03751 family conjugal transfer lipoprotein [Zophobihabitans entericus]|uniref:TIGR03751 family conjugal transfer lipoprotein n=1 Tax=Zophobihabitans entericus TaxID=1635327 RepID=A0A6G9ID02_9GAMM|nr:TIGR03751 family conjugal transfer lipoprotein [Zophobihabitans entericus]QIQ21460.1 TIGR03751 family conjugal transfer lipoprotein [Zophobihabitans entericus]
MQMNWIKPLLLTVLVSVLTLTGCTTSKDKLLPHDDNTMLTVWNAGTGGSTVSGQHGQQLLDARQHLRRPLSESNADASQYTRNAQNEIYSQFKRLPNPDLVMYVFPHLAGTDPVPVPGYSTVFPLYQRVQYAMPGERVETY